MVYVYAPFYIDKSNGIAIAYELVRILNESGIEAKILCSENERYDFIIPDDIKPYYISKAAVPKAIPDDDIMIYLDTVTRGAPKAKKAIYWLLNKPGALSENSINLRPTDVLVAYSTLVHKSLPQLFIIRDERDLFSRIRKTSSRNKDMVSVYFGKVHINTIAENNAKLERIIKKCKKINIITRCDPMDREQMLKSIAQSSLLISYDSLSNINYEATLLGTPVLMMDDAYAIRETGYNAGIYGLAFSEKGLAEARKQVSLAYETYNALLKNQKQAVVECFRVVLEKVTLLHAQPQAQLDNKDINKQAMHDFAEFYSSIAEPFINIDYPHQIPQETQAIICPAARAPTAVPVVKGVEKAIREHGLNRFYLMIKPKWVDTMYRKLPGDLRLRELLFLLFRRMALRIKG